MKYEEEVEAVYKRIEEALTLKTNRKYKDAIIILTNLIPTIEYSDLKSEAISFRSIIYEEIGDIESAKSDILYALSLLEKESYAKYGLEIEMGIICEKEHNTKEARSWYLRALSTAVKATIPGGWGLDRFFKIRNENELSQEELILCTEVVQKSWQVLKLSGEPDLTNLTKTAKYLLNAESKKRE